MGMKVTPGGGGHEYVRPTPRRQRLRDDIPDDPAGLVGYGAGAAFMLGGAGWSAKEIAEWLAGDEDE